MKFTVYCNDCNPVPYKRTTQRQKYVDKNYKQYLIWKSIVWQQFADQIGDRPDLILDKSKKYYVGIVAYYKDKKHGDTDNVAKGINDAIFQKPLSDKYVSGSYDYSYDKNNPRVEVEIREALTDE